MNASERRELLALARTAIEAAAAGWPLPRPSLDGTLGLPRAAFVSLHRAGALRGCIGCTDPRGPLAETVVRMAVAASQDDPRFSPVVVDDVADLEIEISVLGELEPLRSLDDLVLGEHGLVVEQHGRRGLLLPQVPLSLEWDAERFAAATCEKAHLPLDAWRRGAAMWRFTAEVFGEGGPRSQ